MKRNHINLTLVTGIVLFLLFIFNTYWKKELNPTPCSAAVVPLAKSIPKNWDLACQKNVMEISYTNKLTTKESIYSDIADSIILVATKSATDNLAKTDYVLITASSNNLKVEALAKGSDLIKFLNVTSRSEILELLSIYVKIKETTTGTLHNSN